MSSLVAWSVKHFSCDLKQAIDSKLEQASNKLEYTFDPRPPIAVRVAAICVEEVAIHAREHLTLLVRARIYNLDDELESV